MAAFSIRLPDDLNRKLAREARRARKSRSELARDVLADFIRRREEEEFLAALKRAAEVLAADTTARREGLRIAEEGLGDWLAGIEVEERAAGVDPEAKWWN